MKYSLKTKPKLYKIPSNLTEHLRFETAIIEWFEGFEIELRERQMKLNERLKEEPYPKTNMDSLILYAGIGLLKEILGEDE